jgi:deoxyribose-phosphate aldolase
MEIRDILSRVDHTLLRQDATWPQMMRLCGDAVEYGAASVCIPPCFVRRARGYLGDAMRVCTVVGFPNGYSTAETKRFETAEAVANGADEIDMVINVGLVKDGNYLTVLDEIKSVREACAGKILKVIIETCLLTEDEKIGMCDIVSESGADFIKTSTGFAGGGATFEDVALLRKHCAPEIRIKAAGGIKTLADAERFIELGADRLGTSRLIEEAKKLEKTGK